MQKETILIKAVGPYGVLVGNIWYGIDKQSNVDPGHFEKGCVYDVLFNGSESGKKFITQIVDKMSTAPAESPVASAQVKWDKNTQIAIQGILQAVLQSPSLVPFVQSESDLVEKSFAKAKELFALQQSFVKERAPLSVAA